MSDESVHSPVLPALVTLGTPELMRPQAPLDEDRIGTGELRQRLEVLERCMHHYGGIGIAAPQVGWDARVFCLGIEDRSGRYPDAGAIPFEFWINPEIEVPGEDTNWAWEGCLSVPGLRGWIERPAEVLARGLDEHGRSKERHYRGFAARVFQHEFDHLDGVLFPMRAAHPKWLLPEAVMAHQPDWMDDWPSPGARVTGPGALSAIP